MNIDKVQKTQQLFDESGQIWFDVYEAPGIEGQPITALVPRESRNPDRVRRFLLSAGATLASLQSGEHLAETIAADAPIVRRASHTGWRDNASRFVSHSHVAGDMAPGSVVPPEKAITGAAGERSGDLRGWRAIVRTARFSTAMIVALCAAFAAAFLSLLNAPSFALVFVGRSRGGKSTAQLVGASAIGFGEEKSLPSLNATPAGLLAIASAYNDHLLPINEVGTARGAKRDIYEVLHNTTYALMTGQDVLRHPSWTGGMGDVGGSFQVLPLLSSELSPDAWAARRGETRDEGEMARLIGLPVLRAGDRTVFDRAPSNLRGDELHKWTKKRFRRLRRGLPRHRGVAFPAFLDKLVADRVALTERARALVTEFENKCGDPAMSQIQRDILAKFGVLYAGGVIAYELDISPLKISTVEKAVARACRAALAELPDPEAEGRSDRRLLKERLSGGGLLDLDSCSGKELRMIGNADGYRESKHQGSQYTIRAQVFASWFRTPLQTRRMLEWLASEGFLDHTTAPKAGRSNEWAQKQVTWPDGTRQRSISLYLPAGLADLERDG